MSEFESTEADELMVASEVPRRLRCEVVGPAGPQAPELIGTEVVAEEDGRVAPEQEDAGCVVGTHYPHPLVDHHLQKEKALALFKNVS